jgi:hypothetical protein
MPRKPLFGKTNRHMLHHADGDRGTRSESCILSEASSNIFGASYFERVHPGLRHGFVIRMEERLFQWVFRFGRSHFFAFRPFATRAKIILSARALSRIVASVRFRRSAIVAAVLPAAARARNRATSSGVQGCGGRFFISLQPPAPKVWEALRHNQL